LDAFEAISFLHVLAFLQYDTTVKIKV